MQRIKFLIVGIFLCLNHLHCRSAQPNIVYQPELGRFYEEAGVTGGILLYDLRQDRYVTSDSARIFEGFLPASTYKILNALIALETGAIADENEVFTWDGEERSVGAWNRDHDLRSAFRYSVVWYYQELARRIGEDQMQTYVDLVRYGNQDIGGGIDRFWLTGALQISQWQQVEFLKQLYFNDLPFSERTLDIVKDIFVYEEGEGYVLRGKTGWAGEGTPQVGWFVGYLERGDNVYFFANNIDIMQDEDSRARVEITRAILQEMDLLDGP